MSDEQKVVYTVRSDAQTIEDLGWREVLDPPGKPPFPELSRLFVKIGGGVCDWIWQPQDVTLVALAYRIGYCEQAVRLLGVRPRYAEADALGESS